MESESEVKFYFGIIAAMLAFVIIAGGFIMVVIRYQKRLLLKQKELLELDAEYKKELLLTSIKSAEAQRLKLAKDIHDEIGSIFSTLSLSVNQIGENPSNSRHLQTSKKLLQSGIDSVRRISHAIVPFELELLGLEQTLENHFETIMAASGLEVEFTNNARLDSLNETATLALYRIIQELGSNCLKHAQAQKLTFTIQENANEIVMRYCDDGKGSTINRQKMAGGLGLKSIESRVLLLGGSVNINSAPGEGFFCQVNIPLTKNIKT